MTISLRSWLWWLKGIVFSGHLPDPANFMVRIWWVFSNTSPASSQPSWHPSNISSSQLTASSHSDLWFRHPVLLSGRNPLIMPDKYYQWSNNDILPEKEKNIFFVTNISRNVLPCFIQVTLLRRFSHHFVGLQQHDVLCWQLVQPVLPCHLGSCITMTTTSINHLS